MKWLAVVVLSGCGRLAFDVGPDGGSPGPGTRDGGDGAISACAASIGHDEDADGHDDGCDVCPHLPDPAQADADGDRVGDACDPEPALARQQLVWFEPFAVQSAAWSLRDAQITGDELVVTAATPDWYAGVPYTLAHDTFTIGATLQNPNAGDHMLGIFVGADAQPGVFYCELYDTGSESILQYTYSTDGVSFIHPGVTTLSDRFGTRAGIFSYEVDTAHNGVCRVNLDTGVNEVVTGSAPLSIPIDRFHLYGFGVDARVRYIVQIRTLD